MPESKTHTFAFRCMAYKGKNQGIDGYFAICIDLNLATWRKTFDEAKSSLSDAVSGYLEACAKRSEAINFDELEKEIYRPAPIWPYQISYYGLMLVHRLRPRISDNSRTFQLSPATS